MPPKVLLEPLGKPFGQGGGRIPRILVERQQMHDARGAVGQVAAGELDPKVGRQSCLARPRRAHEQDRRRGPRP